MYPAFAGSVIGKRMSAQNRAKWFGEEGSTRGLAPVHQVLPRWKTLVGFRRNSRKPLGSRKKQPSKTP